MRLISRKVALPVFSIMLVFCMVMASCGGGSTSNYRGSSSQGGSGAIETTLSDEDITWDVLCSWVRGNYNYTRLELFKEIVEKNTGGLLNINIVGGPEIVPETEQAEDCINGVVDAI